METGRKGREEHVTEDGGDPQEQYDEGTAEILARVLQKTSGINCNPIIEVLTNREADIICGDLWGLLHPPFGFAVNPHRLRTPRGLCHQNFKFLVNGQL